ncbi:hypothetical protein [Mucilaginibacter dorajii]|uniref:Lipoprotein n=1 Tax=Mucilaginibacter dorajii TaxID=692994 RepID=A0ABP7QYW2_9SPHI|nr:hypothetical protein [Mucilaginibacter dorajii]MCS3732313.1 hypothetical protein [Mucilaginibacter dorajii]
MKNLNSLFIAITFLSIITLGCSNKNSVYNTLDKQFKNSLESVTKSKQLQATLYMVIPRAGCGGCISTAEVYMIQCLQQPKKYNFIRFILTNFDSEKLLRARYGEYYKSNMLIIDKNSVFAGNNSLKSIYPTIYFFNTEQKLYKVSQCSPSENGIGDIMEYEQRKK